MTDSREINRFIASQLTEWPMASANFSALKDVKVKELDVDGMRFIVQFNPARAVSSAAKVDAASLKARKCFLCGENRPAEQRGLDWGEGYTILVNPFPIFPKHLTIPKKEHRRQAIRGVVGDMLRLASEIDVYTVFYNGPRCGASAPDHMHFQAGNSDFLPLADNLDGVEIKEITSEGESSLGLVDVLPLKMFIIDAVSPEEGEALFLRLLEAMPVENGDYEPMLNMLAYRTPHGVRLVVVPRKRHRPSFYGTEGPECMLISPASVDMGGVFVTPREEDFERFDADVVRKLIEELCLSTDEINAIANRIGTEPVVKVGILHAERITVELHTNYATPDGSPCTGLMKFSVTADGKINANGMVYDTFTLTSPDFDGTFTVENVVIGVDFHWQRLEQQSFKGNLKVITEDGALTLINILPVEDYLKSVISSEMSATSGEEFLKAHAVISRSWLLAQIEKREKEHIAMPADTDEEIVRWFDREEHCNFDVCADDHCQRYQGITRQTTAAVENAVAATRGQVLTDENGELCDARFSKCCGGVFEEFENCWEPRHHSYLSAGNDNADAGMPVPDLRKEDTANAWISEEPDAFCNTKDASILSQVLNNYDRETTDFYRWRVDYDQEELSELIRSRSGIDFGEIMALEALERGTSGRIYRLRIHGSRKTLTIGKELLIRRWLSTSHLYSSAFTVEPSETKDADGAPLHFSLRGAGWGHGVGLCQIGAAVMGARGYKYEQILQHYFKGANLRRLY